MLQEHAVPVVADAERAGARGLFEVQRFTEWSRGLSIRYRLMLYLLLGLVPIILVSLYFSAQVYQGRVRQILLGHQATASATAGTVAEFVTGVVRAQGIVALTLSREKMDNAQMISYFEAARKSVPVLRTLGFALSDGRVVAAFPEGPIGANVADRDYFKRLSAGEHWSVSGLLSIRPENQTGFVVAHRVERNGRMAGVLISAIDPESLRRFVSPSLVQGLDYSIMDGSGQVIVSNYISTSALSKHVDRLWIPGVRSARSGKPAPLFPFVDREDGVERMGAAVPVPELGWIVEVSQPVSNALSPLRGRAQLTMALLLLIVTAILISIWLTANRLAIPIKSLARKAGRVAQGDFSQRMLPPDESELGMLANAFNNMTEELRRFRDEEQRGREYESLLADVGDMLISTLDPNAIFQGVAERTLRYLGDAVFIFRLERNGNLSIVGAATKDSEILRIVRERLHERPLSIHRGIGAIIARSRAIFSPDLDRLNDPDITYCMDGLSAASSITVQMRIRGEMLGALSVFSPAGQLSEGGIPVVQELARRLGSALENSRLYEESLEREEFQTGLTRLATAASSTLEPGAVLATTCSQTQELLEADGVYIWVLHDEGDKLHGTSACGFNSRAFIGSALHLEQEGHPIIRAFKDKESFYLHNASTCAALVSIEDWECPIQSAVYQPLVSAGQALGVMVITDTHDPERFDETTLERAGLLAQYAATALSNARAYERERKIAETLQRSLLAEIPERVGNFELAHFYTPARREATIGGDFYDFISIGGNWYDLVIGDVSGKGLQAAVVTALAKYVIRAYAAEDPNPALVLSRANDAVFKYTSAELFITLVTCLLETTTGEVRYSSAGHEPILIYRNQDKRTEYEEPNGIASGILPEAEYTMSSLFLAPGDMLIMYTDGLTDARSPAGEFLGQEGLARLTQELAGTSASYFLDRLVEKVKSFTGGEFSDDIAVLVIRASGKK